MNTLFGGYGYYVITAYGITLIVFGINIAFCLSEKYRIKKILQNYYETES